MIYTVNLEEYCNSFSVPKGVAARLKLASEKQIKVIIACLSDFAGGINEQKIADTLGLGLAEVLDALDFWVDCGILKGKEKSAVAPVKREVAPKKIERPSRADVAKRGLEDEALAMLLNEAQMKFGRSLKSNEAAGIVWMYDDLSLPVSVLLLLLEYAVSEKKPNVTFMEKTAQKWVDAGVTNVVAAEEFIKKEAGRKLAWSRIERLFGIEHRKPSQKEADYALLWLDEWGVSEELLCAAYDECINQKSKLVMGYIAAIIEDWHKKGFKTKGDIESAPKLKPKKSGSGGKRSFAAYDLAAFEKMLNSADYDDDEDDEEGSSDD